MKRKKRLGLLMMSELSENEWGNTLTFESGDHWSHLYGDTEFMVRNCKKITCYFLTV
jgi:hypothetical protein